MLENAIARRYAQAFFAIAQEKNQVDKFEEELTLIMESINSNADLAKFINHQLVKPEAKKDTLQKLFADKISDTTLNLLELLVDKHREVLISEIAKEFLVYANAARNIQEAEITSAMELKDKDLEEIKKKLAECTGKNIRLVTKVNADLIGGVVVRIGDKIIDSSALSRLQGLKSRLKQI